MASDVNKWLFERAPRGAGRLRNWPKPLPTLERFHALLDIAHDRMFGDTEGDLEPLPSEPPS